MQALLSFDRAPPLAAPARFFLTAPLFAALGGLLLLWSGPDIFASRWTPGALALTHLMTAGFMLQAMFGALVQILPVAAGANLAHPLRVARQVHSCITPGALLLVAAFLVYEAWLFRLAVFFLGIGIGLFVWHTGRALLGISSANSTIRGIKLALLGLVVTGSLGVLLGAALGWSWPLPLLQITNVHLTWGFLTWGVILLAAVGQVVVPMFQLTPAYPAWFVRWFPPAALALVSLWTTAALFFEEEWPASLLAATVLLSGGFFALATLNLQRRSKRSKPDATQRYWQGGMLCALAACLLWLCAQWLPPLANWDAWPILFGVLLIYGAFMSVIVGMLYKILPFLVWLHLQNLGRGKVIAPNVRKVLAESEMVRQMRFHFATLLLLLLAVCFPAWLVYPAGLALMASNAWLMRNLLLAVRAYRTHLRVIDEKLAARSGEGGTTAS